MSVLTKVRNVGRGVLQRYGTGRMKRQLWNREFAGGRWDCLDTMAGDCLYPHVERHARNGDILDLGCGPGSTGNELNPSTYRSYTGVDISDVAVAKARRRTAENRRDTQNRYVQADLYRYVPEQMYDVILFGDSLYYLPHARIAAILARYAKHLKPAGVFVARIYDPSGKYRPIVETIERDFAVAEKHVYHGAQISVIAFRPLTERPAPSTAGRR